MIPVPEEQEQEGEGEEGSEGESGFVTCEEEEEVSELAEDFLGEEEEADGFRLGWVGRSKNSLGLEEGR